MTQHTNYGEVQGPPTGEMTRRGFMRRMLGVGVGLLSLEFLGASLAFLWPNLTEGLGAAITLGTADEITALQPRWAEGEPFLYNKANLFFVNVPAGKVLVENDGNVGTPIPDPGLSDFISRVMRQWIGHQVRHRVWQMLGRQFAELLRQRLEEGQPDSGAATAVQEQERRTLAATHDRHLAARDGLIGFCWVAHRKHPHGARQLRHVL